MRSTPPVVDMRGAVLAFACLAMLAAPARAGEGYRALQALDARLHEAGWRLATGNAPFCRETVRASGLLLHDAAAYPDPAEARAAFGLAGDIGVQAVASGSPAARAGLAPDATMTAIAGSDPALRPVVEPRWQRLQTIRDALDAALTQDGAVPVEWRAPGGVSTTGELGSVPACRTRFEVAGLGNRAVADGTRVVLGDRFPGFAYPEDEFAAAVAHELAHNVLGHRAWLDAQGRSQRNVRLTEREADRLAPWLLANAGYDPAAMARFMARWGPRHGGGLFRKRTHEGWDERVEAIEAELPLIAAVQTPDGVADWSAHFRREIAD
jgi:hypothetical protein